MIKPWSVKAGDKVIVRSPLERDAVRCVLRVTKTGKISIEGNDITDNLFDCHGFEILDPRMYISGCELFSCSQWLTDEILHWSATPMSYSSGYRADLTMLPNGTTFYVENGDWNGTIVEKDGHKYVQRDGDNRLVAAEKEELVISDVRLGGEKHDC